MGAHVRAATVAVGGTDFPFSIFHAVETRSPMTCKKTKTPRIMTWLPTLTGLQLHLCYERESVHLTHYPTTLQHGWRWYGT